MTTKWTQYRFGARKAGHADEAHATVDVDALIVEGNALEDAGEVEAALARYRQAAQHAPDSARPQVNIGNALKLLGRNDEAIAAQRLALRLEPAHAGAHCNLGLLLWTAGDPAGAEQALCTALAHKPDLANASILLAIVLAATGRTDEAEQRLRGVLAADPHEAIALHHLAALLLRQDRLEEAEDLLVAARSNAPDAAQFAAALGVAYSRMGRAREAEPLFREALARADLAAEAISPHLFTLNFRDDVPAAQIFEEHRALGALIGTPDTSSRPTWPQDSPAERPLRVGYVSPDFGQHPVGLFIRPVLELHDRTRVDVYCYSNSATEDDMTRALKAQDVRWRSIAGVSDEAAKSMILGDCIDILVDLSGHTTANRLPLFARRCAPVQATWLGYLNTTGVPALDYRLSDRHTDPLPQSAALHTEQLVHLPDSQWCYAPVYDVPQQPPAQPREGLVFGSFNQWSKVGDACLGMWQRVVASAPNAKLRLHGVPGGRARDRLMERLTRAGFAPDAIELHDRVGILEYFRAIEDVDIALDTWPYNGGTTTLDTLWMGTPLVALEGSRSIARGSYSILASLNEPDLIAATPSRYVEINARLARDAHWRAHLRRTLRARLAASPLMDAQRFVRGLEDAYRRMWNEVCQAEPKS